MRGGIGWEKVLGPWARGTTFNLDACPRPYGARDYVTATGVMNTRSSYQALALCGSILWLTQLVFIELASIFPKSQCDVGDLPR
jgi:hypothetical protein